MQALVALECAVEQQCDLHGYLVRLADADLGAKGLKPREHLRLMSMRHQTGGVAFVSKLRLDVELRAATITLADRQSLFETLDGSARERGVTIVPAIAFYGGPADLMVSALAPASGLIDTVEIATGLDSWHPTRGTRLTGSRNTHENWRSAPARWCPFSSRMQRRTLLMIAHTDRS